MGRNARPWPPALDEMLRRLVAKGASGGDAERAIPGKSRSACIARARNLGCPFNSRGLTSGQKLREANHIREVRPPLKVIKVPTPKIVVTASYPTLNFALPDITVVKAVRAERTEISLLKAGVDHCRWLLGYKDPKDGTAMCCGQLVLPKLSYCDTHYPTTLKRNAPKSTNAIFTPNFPTVSAQQR